MSGPSYIVTPHSTDPEPGTVVRRSRAGFVIGAADHDSFRIAVANGGATDIMYPAGAPLTMNTAALVVDRIYAMPFWMPQPGHADQLGFDLTAVAVGAKARAGIYRQISDTDLRPGDQLVDGGEFDCSAAGGTGLKIAPISLFMAPGLYWFCLLGGVLAPTVRAVLTTAHPIFGVRSIAGWTTATLRYCSFAAFPYAPLPTRYPIADFATNISASAGLGFIVCVRFSRFGST